MCFELEYHLSSKGGLNNIIMVSLHSSNFNSHQYLFVVCHWHHCYPHHHHDFQTCLLLQTALPPWQFHLCHSEVLQNISKAGKYFNLLQFQCWWIVLPVSKDWPCWTNAYPQSRHHTYVAPELLLSFRAGLRHELLKVLLIDENHRNVNVNLLQKYFHCSLYQLNLIIDFSLASIISVCASLLISCT